MNNDEEDKSSMFPVRLPRVLVELMDQFLEKHKELAINSRQELARRAIADWIIQKRREMRDLK